MPRVEVLRRPDSGRPYQGPSGPFGYLEEGAHQ